LSWHRATCVVLYPIYPRWWLQEDDIAGDGDGATGKHMHSVKPSASKHMLMSYRHSSSNLPIIHTLCRPLDLPRQVQTYQACNDDVSLNDYVGMRRTLPLERRERTCDACPCGLQPLASACNASWFVVHASSCRAYIVCSRSEIARQRMEENCHHDTHSDCGANSHACAKILSKACEGM
jgi:hypothetical protein